MALLKRVGSRRDQESTTPLTPVVHSAVAVLGALLVVALMPGAARAADELSIVPAVDRAVRHLESSQLPDGGFGSRLVVRDSATVGEALRLVRPDSPAVPQIDAYMGRANLEDVDSLARASIGSPSSSHAGALLAAQREDGGFGLSREYQSDPIDTALALRALTATGERDAARRAADRLLKFASTGVWGADGGDVALTSEALLALDAYMRRFGSSAALDASRTATLAWLARAQDDVGTWGAGALTLRTTALAVNGLAASLPEAARVNAGADALLQSQQPDGSWGDPFTTALAIRALRRAGDLIERNRVTQLADPLVRARDLTAVPQIVESGDPVTVKATVTNAGQATASGATAEFFLEDPASGAAPVATAAVADLAAGAQTTVSGTFDVDRPGGRAQVHVVLRSPVDADRDLTNNTATLNLYVRLARAQFARTRDWPRANRDLQRSGSSPNRLHAVVNSDPIWRAPASGGHIVAEGRVYFGENGQITAREAKTGALVWRDGFSYTDDRYRAPIYTRGWILTASQGTAGHLNAKTGKLEGGMGGWGGDRPVFATETIEVEDANDPTFMYMANLPWINNDEKCYLKPVRDQSGAAWSTNAWIGGSPIYTFNGPPDGWLFFRHKCDGDPLSFSADGPRAFMTNGAWLSSFNPVNGRGPNGEPMLPLFDTKLPDMTKVPAAALVDSLNQVIVAGWEGTSPTGTTAAGTLHSGRGKVVATDPSDGSVLWTFSTNAKLDGTPVEYKGTIIVVDRSGRVYGLDQITGALKWSWMPGDYVPPAADQQGKSGQTLAVSGRYLYVPHPDGKVYTLDARNGSQLSATAFPARPYELAIDDTNNALYVRTLDGYVGAYATQELPDQCAPDPPVASPAPSPIDPVSVGGTTYEPPSMSADGRYVAYTTGHSPRQIRIRDLQTQTTELLPVSDTIAPGRVRTDKHLPVLSEDGRYVGFIARQRDTVYGWDGDMMFVMDRQTGVVEPVLRHPNGAPMSLQIDAVNLRPTDRQSFGMSISGDGRKVAFASYTSGIVPGDTEGNDAFVVDMVTGGRTRLLHGNSPALSRNGRYVAFTSERNLTGAPLTGGSYDRQPPYVYRQDLSTGAVRLISALDSGAAVTGYSPRVSGDGRHVAFISPAPLLYPPAYRTPGWDGWAQSVFIWDATTGRAEFSSPNDTDKVGKSALARPVISDDARYTAFHVAGYFVKGLMSWTVPQIVGRDRTTQTTRLLSHNPYGSGGSGEAVAPAMSADGSRVAFLSSSNDLVADDTVGGYDVFVYERSREGAVPAEPADFGGKNCPPGGEQAEGYSDLSVLPADIESDPLEQRQSAQVRVTVHNEGTAASEPSTVKLYDGDTLIGERPLEAVPAGATAQPAFTWERIPSAGAHTLRAVADPDRRVFEQDLVDNEAEKTLDVAAPRLDLSVATDQPAYGADAPVELTASLGNRSLAGRDVRVLVTIENKDGDLVARVQDSDITLDAGGETTVGGSWNTRDTTAGDYVVRARVENIHGDELLAASAPLKITPDVRAELDLRTGGRVYEATDTARLSALVSNLSANSSLAGARVQLSIAETGDAWELAAGEIMQGRSTQVTQERTLRGVAPGTHAVTAVLVGADGTQIAKDTAQLQVASSALEGHAVSGTLTAEPSDPERFTTGAFRYEATNEGNAALDGTTLRVRISDLEDGTTLKTLDEARALAVGESITGTLTTRMDLPEDVDYQASLHLVLPSGAERPLDRTIIHVRPAPFTHGATLDPAPRERVLVWACDIEDEAVARAALGSTFATFVPDHADPRYANDSGCSRAETRRRFLRLIRSGDYNQFWLLGALPFDLGRGDDELAARVLQGDGLLMAGGGSGPGLAAFSGGNESPFSARRSGNVPSGAQRIEFAPGSAFAGLGATVAGSFPCVKPLQATALATTTWTASNQTNAETTGTINDFGKGTAIYLAPAPSAFTDPSAAVAFLRRAADVLRSDAEGARGSGLAWLDLFVEGVAPGAPLQLRAQLPEGTGAPDLPADATLADGLLTLPFEAAGEQRRHRGVWLKLPPTAGDRSVGASVFYRDAQDGQIKRFGEPATASIQVTEDEATARDTTLAALSDVVTRTQSERWALRRIEDDVNATAAATSDPGTIEARLKALVEGIGTLERSGWTNAERARTALARLITYVQYDHYRTGGA